MYNIVCLNCIHEFISHNIQSSNLQIYTKTPNQTPKDWRLKIEHIIGIIFSANFYIEVDFFLCGVGGDPSSSRYIIIA